MAFLLLPSGAVCAEADAPITIETLVEMWRERDAKVRTVRVDYRQERMVTRGSQMAPPDAAPNKPYPEEDVTHVLQSTLRIDGERWRYDRRGLSWHQPAGRFVEMHYLQLFDGEQCVLFNGVQEEMNEAYPHATVYTPSKTNPSRFAWSSTISPIFLNFRNGHIHLQGIQSPDWRLADERAVIDGRECLLIEDHSSPNPTSFHRCWHDPERGYRIVRRELGHDDFMFSKVDIQYREDEQFEWLPTAWTTVLNAERIAGGASLQETAEFTVENLEINAPIEEAVFDAALPEGTWVDDGTRDKKWVSYLVEEEAEERPITEQELARGATYEELRATETGQAGRQHLREDGSPWWVWGIGSVCVILAGVWMLRRNG